MAKFFELCESHDPANKHNPTYELYEFLKSKGIDVTFQKGGLTITTEKNNISVGVLEEGNPITAAMDFVQKSDLNPLKKSNERFNKSVNTLASIKPAAKFVGGRLGAASTIANAGLKVKNYIEDDSDETDADEDAETLMNPLKSLNPIKQANKAMQNPLGANTLVQQMAASGDQNAINALKEQEATGKQAIDALKKQNKTFQQQLKSSANKPVIGA